jgi:hypothetical protein
VLVDTSHVSVTSSERQAANTYVTANIRCAKHRTHWGSRKRKQNTYRCTEILAVWFFRPLCSDRRRSCSGTAALSVGLSCHWHGAQKVRRVDVKSGTLLAAIQPRATIRFGGQHVELRCCCRTQKLSGRRHRGHQVEDCSQRCRWQTGIAGTHELIKIC